MKRYAQDVTRSGDDGLDAMFDGLQAIHAGKSNQPIARAEQDGVAQAGGDAATIGLFALGIIAEDELAAQESVPLGGCRTSLTAQHNRHLDRKEHLAADVAVGRVEAS